MSVQSVKDKENRRSAQIREDGKYNLIKGRDYIVTVRGSRQPYEDLEITFEITAVDLIINGIVQRQSHINYPTAKVRQKLA